MPASFSTTLQGSPGSNATGIVVPEDAMALLGPGKKYPVVVTVSRNSSDPYAFRNTVSWYKGAFMIGMSTEHREAAGLSAGDPIAVMLEIDDQPRVLELAEDFTAAMGDRLPAFRALSYSKQRGLYEPWEKAKSQETRARNLARILAEI